MVLPPSIPNLPRFAVMCGILDQGGAWFILQPIVLKKCFGLFSLFSLQAVMCLLQVFILNIFTVGLSFFLIVEICMFVAILDLFLIVFLLWISLAQFWLFLLSGTPISAQVMDSASWEWIFSSSSNHLVWSSKAITLS